MNFTYGVVYVTYAVTLVITVIIVMYAVIEEYRKKHLVYDDEDNICCNTCKYYNPEIHECPNHRESAHTNGAEYYCDDWDSAKYMEEK